MNEERDKFLTEAIGECWHQEKVGYGYYGQCHDHMCCVKCGTPYQESKQTLSSWEGFGKLWEWATKQDWWYNFKVGTHCGLTVEGVYEYYINPDELADTIYAYLKERK